MRGALQPAEAQVAALTAALAPRFRRLRCEWDGRPAVRLEVRAGRRTVGVAVGLDLVVLAPTEALAAELESHLAALTAGRSRRRAPGRRLAPRPSSCAPPTGASNLTRRPG